MALISRSVDASIDAAGAMYVPQIPDLIAGEDLDAAAPCYIKASDGKVYMSDGTADDEKAKVDGFTARAAKAGQPITLFGKGARFFYGTGLTPGADYYVATTKGRLDTAATTGGKVKVARAINSTDIRVTNDAV